jgi:hypothetical protein
MSENYLKLVIKLIKNQLVTDEEALILIKNIHNDLNSTKGLDENFWIPSEEINHPKTNKDIQTDQNVIPKWLDRGIMWEKDTWTQKKNTTPFGPWNPWEPTYPSNINISDFPPSFNVTCDGNSFHDEYKVPDKK